MTPHLYSRGKALPVGWKRGRVARDERGRLWLIRSLRFVPGWGVRVFLERPRAASFPLLAEAAKSYTVVGELPRRASVTA